MTTHMAFLSLYAGSDCLDRAVPNLLDTYYIQV